jgi:homoserine/homoserine lactone efflux protein
LGDLVLNWTLWWLFVPTETVLCLTPGPAVLLVLATALRRGPGASAASTLGILSANSIYFALSATGLGAVLLASYRIFFLIKWAGAAYLIYLGVRALLSKSSALGRSQIEDERARSARQLFMDGLLLQLSNPKAIVFFAALLPEFIDPRGDLVAQVVVLGITSLIIESGVLLIYGLAAGRVSAVARQPRYTKWTNRVSGVLLIGAGSGLAALRRS